MLLVHYSSTISVGSIHLSHVSARLPISCVNNLHGRQQMAPCYSGCLAAVRHTREPHQYTGTHGAFQAGMVYTDLLTRVWQTLGKWYIQTYNYSSWVSSCKMIIVGLAHACPNCAMYHCVLNFAGVPGKLHDSNAKILPDPLAVGRIWYTSQFRNLTH